MIFSKFTNVNASEKITVKERLAYGCGDFSSNIMYSAMAAFLMFYYTDYIGVSAAVVGSIMLFSRIFDGISDLIMGVIIDHTKSPFGKARIWILRLVIPYAIGTVLLFSVPAFPAAAATACWRTHSPAVFSRYRSASQICSPALKIFWTACPLMRDVITGSSSFRIRFLV